MSLARVEIDVLAAAGRTRRVVLFIADEESLALVRGVPALLDLPLVADATAPGGAEEVNLGCRATVPIAVGILIRLGML